MSRHDWLLLVHIAGAFCVLAGALLAVVLSYSSGAAVLAIPAGSRALNRRFTRRADSPCSRQVASTPMSVPASALLQTPGYLVADARGRVVGRVECPMYGTQPDIPDALSVRRGFFGRRRRLVPADAIEQIDGFSGVVGLSVDRDSLRSFL